MEGPTPVSALIHAATMVCTTKDNNINVSSINKSLDPYFVTGYSDGESSFSIRLRKSIDSKWGYKILPVFSIGAQINPHNKILLEKVKEFFPPRPSLRRGGGRRGIGWISASGNMFTYEVTSFNSLQVIRKHFEKYPLETSKSIHFLLWCEVIDLLLKKVHYTHEGFLKILAIKAVFPKGLSDNVLKAHPNVVPINKPEFLPKTNLLNPHWVAGFVQADGTFGLNFIKQVRMKLGFTCQPQFRVTQHERDLMVLNRIISTMGCGNIVKPSSGRDRYDISVANIKDIARIVIPFFEKYRIYGAKYLDFQSFCKGISIIENKGHLTQQGLDQLKNLAYSMNTYRKF